LPSAVFYADFRCIFILTKTLKNGHPKIQHLATDLYSGFIAFGVGIGAVVFEALLL
jgi:hypothetical protein